MLYYINTFIYNFTIYNIQKNLNIFNKFYVKYKKKADFVLVRFVYLLLSALSGLGMFFRLSHKIFM